MNFAVSASLKVSLCKKPYAKSELFSFKHFLYIKKAELILKLYRELLLNVGFRRDKLVQRYLKSKLIPI